MKDDLPLAIKLGNYKRRFEDAVLDRMLPPAKPSCKKCHGRGYTGWDAPVGAPAGYKGNKVFCTCRRKKRF